MRPPQSIIRYRFVPTLHLLITSLIGALLSVTPAIAAAPSPQFTSYPAGLRFGTVAIGQNETLMATVTNNGTTSLTVSQITISNPAFTTSAMSLPLVVSAGQSVSLNVTFTPTATGWTGGTIKFVNNISNTPLPVEVGGVGVNSEPLTASPSIVSFSNVAVGSNSSVPVVLKNTLPSSVTLSTIQTTGSQFSVSAPTLPLTLQSGQSITLNVAFKPQSAGTVGGSIFISSPIVVIPLTGTAITGTPGQLSIAPAPLSFGSVPVGTTQTQSITVNAVGASVTVSSAASSSSQFVLNGASFPLTIPAGQGVSFNVAFTPQSSGALSGSITLASNASNSQAVESMSGTGTTTSYSVNLWWNPSNDVVGYNVYRSMASNGTYVKINSAVNAATAYSDSTVASGNTYYYAATSVNASGQESARSSPVSAAVP